MSIKTMKRNKTIKGFTLIEVMIAMLLLSIGMIGIAGILASALKSSSSNYANQQAVQYTYDIADRMRSNYLAAHDPSNSNPYIAALSAPASSAPSPDCTSSKCSATQMAAYDIWQWKTLLKSTLPSGLGSISVATAGPGNQNTLITVYIQWSDASANAVFNPSANGANTNGKLTVVTAL